MTETGASRGAARARLPAAGVLLGCLLTLDACASAGEVRLEPTRPPGTELVWPAPPDQPRIRFVRSFSSASELGFRRSLLGRVVDFVRGGSGDERLQHPYGLAVTQDSRIYVVDSSAKGVHEYDLPRGRHRFFTSSSLIHPIGVAVGTGGRIYVTDSEAGAVVILDAGGDEVGRIEEGLGRPTGIAIHPGTGDVYVVDTEGHRVVVLDELGTPRMSFGRRGSGAGGLNFPTLIAIGGDGTVYVSDSLNFRVQVFTSDGTPLRSIGRLGDAVGEFARPKGLSVDAQGRLYVVEGLYDVVNVFDARGRLLLTLGGAGRAEGSFWLATDLTVDARGRIFVSDSFNSRVQIFEMLEAPAP